MKNKTNKKSLENDPQIREARTEIEFFGKRIGELKTLDESDEHVRSTIGFLELMIKVRKDALRKFGLDFQIPEGQKPVRNLF